MLVQPAIVYEVITQMTSPEAITCILIAAYLTGSIPTALIVSRRLKGIDIRTVGDGNMGARNTFHEISPGYGVIVALLDFAKGALPVYIAGILGLNLTLQFLTGVLAISGHDFPVFAKFHGGQGTATSLGTMFALFPLPTLTGLAVFGVIFLLIRNFNISCGAGGAVIAAILAFTHQWLLLVYAVVVFLCIPGKLYIDKSRRKAIKISKNIGT